MDDLDALWKDADECARRHGHDVCMPASDVLALIERVRSLREELDGVRRDKADQVRRKQVTHDTLTERAEFAEARIKELDLIVDLYRTTTPGWESKLALLRAVSEAVKTSRDALAEAGAKMEAALAAAEEGGAIDRDAT